MQVTLIFSILYLIPSYLMAWDSPWAHKTEPIAPWVSIERENQREGFFSQLSSDISSRLSSKDDSEEKATAMVDESDSGEETLSRDLSELPWGAHRTLYPQEKFKRQLMWPVTGARVGSGFGLRNGRNHEGLDISGKKGESIHAIADGRIVFSGKMSGYGNIIVVYHGDGISSVYAHNLLHIAKRGQLVKRGDLIAKVGRSGSATGYHCHFEIRVDGRPVNPFLYTYSGSPYLAQR